MAINPKLKLCFVVIAKLGVVTFISVGICIAMLYSTLTPLQLEINTLKSSLATSQTTQSEHTGSISQLQSQVMTLTSMTELLQTHIKALTADKQTLQDRLATLDMQKTEADELALRYKTQIAELAVNIQQLSQRTAQMQAWSTQQVTDKQKRSSPNQSSIAKKIKSSPPPFTLHSIQLRGSAYVAVVSPLTATSLADVALVKMNDLYLGWHIARVHPSFIEIKQSNKTITLQVSK